MRITLFTTILLLLALMTSCEKSIANEGNGKETTPSSDTKTIDNDAKDGAMTIAEAQAAEEGTQICVKGYIIASTHQSINNIDFDAPFEGSTAIVLASKKVTDDEDQIFYSNEVFPVCLTDASKGIRESFNLEKNPQYWNCYVYIYGTREQYMNMPGLKKVQSIEVDPNHVPEADETDNDNNDDSGNIDNPENDDPASDDNNGGEGDNNQGDNSGSEGDNGGETIPNEDDSNTSSVLTVAKAKKADKGEKIKVQGYIVGAVSGGDFGTSIYYSFDYPDFDNDKAGIILADKPYDKEKKPTEQYDLTNYTDLLLVGLSDCKPSKLKNELNLVANPNHQNRRILLSGTRKDHLGQDGLKEITAYEFIE